MILFFVAHPSSSSTFDRILVFNLLPTCSSTSGGFLSLQLHAHLSSFYLSSCHNPFSLFFLFPFLRDIALPHEKKYSRDGLSNGNHVAKQQAAFPSTLYKQASDCARRTPGVSFAIKEQATYATTDFPGRPLDNNGFIQFLP